MPPKKKWKAPELDVVFDVPVRGVKRVRGSGTYDTKYSRLIYNAYFYSDGACDEITVVGGKRKSPVIFSTKAPVGSDKTELPSAEWPTILEQHDESVVRIAIKKLRVAAKQQQQPAKKSLS